MIYTKNNTSHKLVLLCIYSKVSVIIGVINGS